MLLKRGHPEGLWVKEKYTGMNMILVTMATVSMWMVWACTWLAQWHPLFPPAIDEIINKTSTGTCRIQTKHASRFTAQLRPIAPLLDQHLYTLGSIAHSSWTCFSDE
jgi:hypothetical protein